MATRDIITNVIVDANVAAVTAAVEDTDDGNEIAINYIGAGKMMITSYDPQV